MSMQSMFPSLRSYVCGYRAGREGQKPDEHDLYDSVFREGMLAGYRVSVQFGTLNTGSPGRELLVVEPPEKPDPIAESLRQRFHRVLRMVVADARRELGNTMAPFSMAYRAELRLARQVVGM